MTKIIGIKELQTKTKHIRKEVEKGVHFIVIYRSKPIFEIKPLQDAFEFSGALESTSLYTEDFIKRMQEAEENIKSKNTKSYTTDTFLKSL